VLTRFPTDPNKAFESGITEVAFCTFPSHAGEEALKEMDEMSAPLTGHLYNPEVGRCTGDSTGWGE